jgi:zinc transport system ATP-binding protein
MSVIATPLLQVEHLSVSYASTQVLDDISFHVDRGDYIGITGPNGAGKSTLVKALLDLIPLQSGKIQLFSQPLSAFHDWYKIGYVPQGNFLINPLFPATVYEVVAMGLLALKHVPKWITKQDDAAIQRVMDQLDITNLQKKLVGQLSGGQLQRVFLARALVHTPEILILDEPNTGLDVNMNHKFFELLDKLNKEKQLTILVVTHDIGRIGEHVSKLLYIDRSLVFDGTLQDFCRSVKMRDYFGAASQHIICHQHH